ncbi:Response regulator ArlR [Roseimaritima multifibrata]|uniref:Response regulator ArlR n=1 Tax=Roseimaritima multifibrata TaxID=1930274 RepID=A0A517MKZ3_9BACT|nr:response regulator transcription factor [Roseimaritima multifibrata]QDS95558.1 Response regulator ArlR [Roseimaritima multifibrata]
MSKTSVLIIEDDSSIADVISYNLRQQDYEVFTCDDGVEGLAQARRQPVDVIILDLMLPGMDGLEICRKLKADKETRKMRVLMLTAKAEESDQLVGFTLGADDYVTKPFSVKILLERVKSLCRRDTTDDYDSVISAAGITIDPVKFTVHVDGTSLQLTRSEFVLLETLARNRGRVFSRGELLDAILGDGTIVMERTVDVHIRAVRRKLGERADVVETVRGVGYRFCSE